MEEKEVAISIEPNEIQIRGFNIPDDEPECFWEGHIKDKLIILQKVVPVENLTLKERRELWKKH